MSELTKHQQQGISLRTFAEQTGIREGQLRHYAKTGRILGARKHPLTKKWWIYPPAKLLFPDSSTTYARRQQARSCAPQVRAGVSAAAELPDLLPGGSAVAVEAGTKSGQSGRCVPQVEAGGGLPSVGGVGVSPGVLPSVFVAPAAQETL